MMLVVAERFGLMRDGLVALLSQGQERHVRAAATLGQAMALLSQGEGGGVLVLDLGLLESVAAGLQEVRARHPAWRIVALAERDSQDGVLHCLAAGAHGYVAKTAVAEALVRAVQVVEQGGVHVPAGLEMAPQAVNGPASVSQLTKESVPVSQLTGRQRDVLRLMAEGRSTKDIARTLDLAVSTIKVHLAAVYRTVGARNRVEALCRAGLLPGGGLVSS